MYCVLQIYPVDKVIAQHYSWEEFVEKISVDEYDDRGRHESAFGRVGGIA